LASTGCPAPPGGCSLGVVTIRWFTDADRVEQARIVREGVERDELLLTFAGWLADRAEHDGLVTVPELTPETEARLLRLLRDGRATPTP
jgi:hypothetical protein